ncbi:energy coupling factor transporter S component ThiW [Candidatus Geothermarchaeota archaeon]|nr:MAG: energy coupling factor transporter S component ThiW [Candidatus Geothermarchaeota archaeon]
MALNMVIAPLWFPFLATKAFPGQHLINSIAGVYLGPIWAAVIAAIVGVMRNALGIGTIYAFPGGIPGGIIVGLMYNFLRKFLDEKKALISALFEPVGTLFVGAPLALFMVSPLAPLFGQESMSLAPGGYLITLLYLWVGWGASCIPGSVIAFMVLVTLEKSGLNRRIMFGEKNEVEGR